MPLKCDFGNYSPSLWKKMWKRTRPSQMLREAERIFRGGAAFATDNWQIKLIWTSVVCRLVSILPTAMATLQPRKISDHCSHSLFCQITWALSRGPLHSSKIEKRSPKSVCTKWSFFVLSICMKTSLSFFVSFCSVTPFYQHIAQACKVINLLEVSLSTGDIREVVELRILLIYRSYSDSI